MQAAIAGISFNPPPIRRQGETFRLVWSSTCQRCVSIRPPSEDRGKLHFPVLCITFPVWFQSAPHPKTGGNLHRTLAHGIYSTVSIRPPSEDRGKPGLSYPSASGLGFNPPPIRRQGETIGTGAIQMASRVSIRPPSEDRGKQPRHPQHPPSPACFNPPPIRRQGETFLVFTLVVNSLVFQSAPHPKTGGNNGLRFVFTYTSVSIRPPSEDRGKRGESLTSRILMSFQSAPHPKTGGNNHGWLTNRVRNPFQSAPHPKTGGNGCRSARRARFNPPPIRRQGETSLHQPSWHHSNCFNPPPIRRQGETPNQYEMLDRGIVFQSAPHPKTGGNPRRARRAGCSSAPFQSAPHPKTGGNLKARTGWAVITVSIRPPSEDRGKLISILFVLPVLIGFNPPPIRRQGETCVP